MPLLPCVEAPTALHSLWLANAVLKDSYRALVVGCWPSLGWVAASATEFALDLFFSSVEAGGLGRELILVLGVSGLKSSKFTQQASLLEVQSRAF